MGLKQTFILLSAFLFGISSINAQGNWYDQDEKDTASFSIGFNIGAFFPNNKTAALYSGAPWETAYGIDFAIQQRFNKQILDQYFQFPYSISEYPIDSRYKTAFEIGLHLAYDIGPPFAFFMDLNTVQLDYRQNFTIEVQNPNSSSINRDFRQFPVIAEENRFNLNLGAQYYYYETESSKAYVSMFGNLQGMRMERNYFIIDNRDYAIFHTDPGINQEVVGGVGLGVGLGLGLKIQLSDKIWVDPNYQFYYTEIKLTDRYTEFLSQHTLRLRVLWK